jgi:hypothetical protein
MSENDNVAEGQVNLSAIKTPEELTTIAEEIKAEVESEVDVDETDDLNKKTYVKITPTLYIKPVESDKKNDEGEKIEIYKILNPIDNTLETRELTGEEKREIQIARLKASRVKFHPTKHGLKTVGTQTIVSSIGRERKIKEKEVQTNITINKFNADYRKKRQRKNKMTKASRRANR